MHVPRLSASSYSNTAPLLWSFLYGSQHGRVELILDNAPARSAELLEQDRVDAALVPVIAFQTLAGVQLVPDVCVGANGPVKSVCLVTRGRELADVRSAALDRSSRTSVILAKILFREFIGHEPSWTESEPDAEKMLANADAALLIGDPALQLRSAANAAKGYRIFDLAELWKKHTGYGFVFAMWMTRSGKSRVDLAAARDEGLAHVEDIAQNYFQELGVSREEMVRYLTGNIRYSIDESMQKGLELYFELAERNGLIGRNRPLEFAGR